MKSLSSFHSHKVRPLDPSRLSEIYEMLQNRFGPQGWWPGDTTFEIIAGAILTQNTAWTNVEKAIANLKKADVLTPYKMRRISLKRLALLIRPSGYFNLKAKRLKSFLNFLFKNYGGSLDRMFQVPFKDLREKLLRVKGVGPETADSILLYAGGKAVFVVDAYTKRIFSRHRLKESHRPHARFLLPGDSYQDWQNTFHSYLPSRHRLFNDFHAQIVLLAKIHCLSRSAHCAQCPLKSIL